MKVTKQRSALKAITWRVVGTADTFVISWAITKEPVTAGAIAEGRGRFCARRAAAE